ncbi:flagellin [uncultured Azohydromonas sp.]|jgi:Flagellin and related hook-associated proteins|uniref:flagellin N-terminal helical domain-containing protein n=1 Tax=uncultured Azohydromonas sp. TaxID=487342 RepID=UPI00260F1901|nr:flagellin [uncultured Azohydromonas sp.]
MGISVNTNLSSLNAQRNIASSQGSLATSMQRLSSGLRVNSAKDDAAGLAIAERMTSQVRGMNQAIRNANDGISMVQTMESTWGKVSDNLQRMRELAVQSANDTNNTSDRESLNKEFQKLGEEINRVIKGTTFNKKDVLATAGGGSTGSMTFQVGANTTANVDTITIQTSDWTQAQVNNGTGVATDNLIDAVTNITNGGTMANIGAAASSTDIRGVIDDIDAALGQVNDERATLGAYQSHFDAAISNLQSASEAQSAARSRIMDADYASETANLSRAQILQQAGQAMLAQANQQPQQVMSLLR